MGILIAIVTSKTAIVLSLAAAAYYTLEYSGDVAPLWLVVVLWTLFAATVGGRAVTQSKEEGDAAPPEEPT